MEPSLENHAALLKGYLLNQQTPPEIMAAVNAILSRPHLRTVGNHAPFAPLVDITDQADETIGARVQRPAAPLPPPALPPAPPGRRPRRCKLSADDLADIQRRHDNYESNGVIGQAYNVSDQTIVNFLKQYGSYEAKAVGGRPKRAEDYNPATDIMGEPLVTPPPAAARYDAKVEQLLAPGQLVDIHDMMAAGKNMQQIADHLLVPKNVVEAFVLRHRNAQITKCAARAGGIYGDNHLVKPAGRKGYSGD